MKKILWLLALVSICWSCSDDDGDARLLSFKIDGTEYRSLVPGAILTSNNNGSFDIQINTVETNWTFNILLEDKPLQTAYADVLFAFNTDGTFYASSECASQLGLSITFQELTVNTSRLNGTFSGKVCNGGTEFTLTEGLMENIPLF